MLMRLTTASGRARESRFRGDRGSALMLMPAAVLIVLVLGAIAVDMSVVHLAKRDLVNLATSAANDAATFGIDPAGVRDRRGRRLDPKRVEQSVQRSLAFHHPAGRIDPPEVTIAINNAGVEEVTVTLHMTVEYIFAKALPGRQETTITAAGTASGNQR
jgi:Putative Flp pilus-assembly TadE/G-like